MRAGFYAYPKVDRVYFGCVFETEAAREAKRRGAGRVFVLAGGTLSRTTDVVDRLRAALGSRFAGVWTRTEYAQAVRVRQPVDSRA